MNIIESSSFSKWLKSIKDPSTKAKIASRVNRLAHGLPGDVKPIGEGLSELRCHFGAGYRVYYYQDQEVLILLINGGDKKNQSNDIKKAKQIFQDWKGTQNEH